MMMMTYDIQLTEEDRAEIRENAALLRHDDEAEPSIGLYSRLSLPCVVNPTMVNTPRWTATCFPRRSHLVTYTTHPTRGSLRDVSRGFRWQANRPWFPTEKNIIPQGRMDLSREPGRIDLGPVVCKVIRTFEGSYAFNYGEPTVVELFEPDTNANCFLLSRIEKERRRIRYERACRDREDETREVDVRRVPKDLKKEWNKIIGMPESPIYESAVTENPKEEGTSTESTPSSSSRTNGYVSTVADFMIDFMSTDSGDHNALAEMWIENNRKPFEAEKAPKVERLLQVFFRNASPEEVLADETMVWIHQAAIDPDTLKERTLAQQRMMRRRMVEMKELESGRCPTGTCPNDICAKPSLSHKERMITHALHITKRLATENLTGRHVVFVRLNGVVWTKVLPEASMFPGETENERSEAAFDELVRQEMNAAEKLARQKGTSVRAARAERKAAFDAVTEIVRIKKDGRNLHGKIAEAAD